MKNKIRIYLALLVGVIGIIIFLKDRQKNDLKVRVEASEEGPSDFVMGSGSGELRTNIFEEIGAVTNLTQALKIPAKKLAYLPDELILRVSPENTIKRLESILDQYGIKVIRTVDKLGLVRVKLPESMDLDQANKLMDEIGGISEKIKNYKTEIPKDFRTLPPTLLTSHLQAVAGAGKDMIKMGDKLKQSSYGDNVTVAVIDTGVDTTHPDLSDRTLGGYNFVDDNGNVEDLNGHGTACAGIIAANSKGMVGLRGIAPKAYILPIKVMADNGKGNSFSVIEGIVYAVDQGAKVINLSLGTKNNSSAIKSAIDYAIENGVVVVAAAGNDGGPDILVPGTDQNVICVGAVDGKYNYAPFSNYGEAVDLVAPGVLVNTTSLENEYTQFSGTSAATPFVSGAIAAIMSENPFMTGTEAKDLILASADDLGNSDRDNYYGHGVLNLKRALSQKGANFNDVAVTALFLEPSEMVAGAATTINFIIENQGNQKIRNLEFVYRVNGVEEIERIKDVGVSESLSVQIPWKIPLELDGGIIKIEGVAVIDGSDIEPNDNGRGLAFRPIEKDKE